MFLPLPVCVKSSGFFSEVFVLLILSCTINPESVPNLRTRKTDWVSRCLLHLCHVRLVMSVVLFSVRVVTSESSVVTTGIACSDSNMTFLLHVHIVSALYSTVFFQLHGLSLPVRTGNALQNELTNNGTPAVLSARAHLLDVMLFLEHFFLEADSLQTLPTHQNSTDIILGNTK